MSQLLQNAPFTHWFRVIHLASVDLTCTTSAESTFFIINIFVNWKFLHKSAVGKHDVLEVQAANISFL